MAAAQTSFLSLEGFERLNKDEKPYVEYWFGKAIPKEMPTLLHGLFQWVLAMMLDQRGWNPSTEVRIKISDHAHPIPDIIADDKHLQGPYPTRPFGLCIEIVYPKDDIRNLLEKGAHYLDWGIENVWIIDPDLRKAYVMTSKSPAPVELDSTGCLIATSTESSVSLPLVDLFAEVDKRR